MASRRILVVATSLILGGTFLIARGTGADDTEPNPAKSALVTAAKAALEATQTEYEVGQSSAEEIYVWSKRLMEAELASGADRSSAMQHVTRMKSLFERVATLARVGAAGGEASTVAATTYYFEEAKALAAKAASR